MRVLAWLLLLPAVLTAAGLPQEAEAHATQLSSSKLTVRGNAVEGVLELNGRDVEVATKGAVVGADGNVDPQRLHESRDALASYIRAHARMTGSAGRNCEQTFESAEPKSDHILVHARWQCAQASGALSYAATLFHEIDASARHMVTVEGDVSLVGLLSAGSPSLVIAAAATNPWEVAWRYLLAGIEHIAIGYDHIAFLVAVILWGRRFWPLAKVVTAFTVAHSITLSLAVLEIVRLPSALVETLIALSIVYVAAENFFVRDLRHRWWITFLFGLVHGFGFASVLRDYGLPRDALAPALAAFNVGVEVGQIAIVVASLLVFAVVDRVIVRGPAGPREPDVRFVRAVSGVVLLLGLYWTWERLTG